MKKCELWISEYTQKFKANIFAHVKFSSYLDKLTCTGFMSENFRIFHPIQKFSREFYTANE